MRQIIRAFYSARLNYNIQESVKQKVKKIKNEVFKCFALSHKKYKVWYK